MTYIPQRDAEARDWYNNFAAVAAANQLALGLTPGDVTAINSVAGAFNAAFLIASNPPTRTSASIAAKNAARANASFVIRPFAMRINGTPSVSNLLRVQLGITVRDRNPSQQPAPVTQPILAVINATPGEHLVRYADSLSPASRRKPVFATSMQLFKAVSASDPVTDPTEAVFQGNFSRNPVRTINAPGDSGKLATYFARWVNRRGEVGPWSTGASLVIA